MGRNRIKFTDTPSDSVPYYRPTDYYSVAAAFAKHYCKKRPDADKMSVYLSAQEAAELYESKISRFYRVPFKNFVYWKIRNDMYIHEREIMGQKSITPEIKKKIIADKLAGMSNKELAGKYGQPLECINTNIYRWRKQGLLSGTDPQAGAKEETGDSAKTADELPEEPGTAPEEPPPETAVDNSSFWYSMIGKLREFAESILGEGLTVTEAEASKYYRTVSLTVLTADGKQARLKFEVLTNEE